MAANYADLVPHLALTLVGLVAKTREGKNISTVMRVFGFTFKDLEGMTMNQINFLITSLSSK